MSTRCYQKSFLNIQLFFFLAKIQKTQMPFQQKQTKTINQSTMKTFTFTPHSLKIVFYLSHWMFDLQGKTSWKAHCGTTAMKTRVIHRHEAFNAHLLSVKYTSCGKWKTFIHSFTDTVCRPFDHWGYFTYFFEKSDIIIQAIVLSLFLRLKTCL